MIGWLRKLFGGKASQPQPPKPDPEPVPRPRSRYDAAQSWSSNKAAWAGADMRSGRSANSLQVRQILRNRSRYEEGNNGYAGGLIGVLADDTVGCGPRLQVMLADPAQNRALEAAWCLWAEGHTPEEDPDPQAEGVDPLFSAGLAGKLHLMAQARPRDGEAFALLVTDEALASPVKLNLIVLETDQVTTPFTAPLGPVDGCELDRFGRPRLWHVLKEHPGDLGMMTAQGQFVTLLAYDAIPVSRMLHWVRPKRAGEVRGVPEITASLPLYAQLRDWTNSTLTAAAVAAKFAGILKPGASQPGAPASDPGAPFEEFPVSTAMFTSLPPDAEFEQMESRHPNQEYGPFKQELIKEGGMPVRAPLSKAGGDTSPYNYSSAQLAEENYWSAIGVVRGTCKSQVLDRLFFAWLQEARLLPNFLRDAFPQGIPGAVPHVWHWPGRSAIDPLKDAQATTERLNNKTTTLAREYARQGLDWEAELRQMAKERDLMAELGLSPAAAGMPPSTTPPSDMPNYPDETPPPAGSRWTRFTPRPNGHTNGRAHP